MDKIGHTPGPWEVERVNDWNGTVRYLRADGDLIMADTRYYPWCPESDADWNLIGAAPDLLASVRALYLILFNGMTAGYDDMTAALGDARRAIEKAEGQQT